MKFGAALTDKIIAVSLGAVATSDARERAKRAAYDWLMASAARRFSTSLPQLALHPPLPLSPRLCRLGLHRSFSGHSHALLSH
jgi:hypothetical protein